MSTLVTVIFVFLSYTALKAAWMWPAHAMLASVLTVPFFGLMLAWQFIFRSNQLIAETVWYRALANIGSLFMGTWATFIVLTFPIDVVRSFGALMRAVHPALLNGLPAWSSPEIYQRLLAASLAFAVLGHVTARRGPIVKRVSAHLPGLPAALRGFRISQISDLHVGPTIRREYVEDVVQKSNQTDPYIVVVTGDLADADAPAIESQLEPMRRLKSRFGIYYVTGNHEYYHDAEGLIGRARELGWRPLINENAVVERGGGRVMIVGITDPMGEHLSEEHRPDLAKAARGAFTDVKVLLAHRPEACLEAEKLGFDLQFSGHTHNGQFFPFNLLIRFFHRYHRGLNRHGNMWVYVNPGTGYWGPVNRFGNAAEITAFTLA